MTRPYFRLLDARNRSASTTNGSDGSPGTDAASSDFVLILAALLCALICVLGLVAIARCAWLRRLSREQSPNSAKANRALKKKILRSLPKVTFGPESAPKFSDCAICLAEFAAGDEIRVLPQCSHSFHVACIDTWLGSHSSCPSCRQILVLSASCEKCGDFPDNSTGGGVGGGVEAEAIEARLKYREDINRFLP